MEPEGREVRLLNEALLPNVVAGEEATKGEMKRRVLYLSIILAVYVVVNALVQYAFDAAAMETMLEQVRRFTKAPHGGPLLPKLLISFIPHLLLSIFLGLLVPMCGYLGAKQNSQGLVGCFCGCNALHCGCSLCALLGSVIFLAAVPAVMPGIERYLELCDPQQCSHWPDSFSEEVKRQRTVDCLAAGAWPKYEKLFDGPEYPAVCPKVMLKCNYESVAPPVIKRGFGPQGPWMRGPPGSGGAGGTIASPADPDMPAEIPISMPVKDFFGSMPRRLQLWHRRHRHRYDGDDFDDFTDDMLEVKPMPPNPIADCQPDETNMKSLHEVSIVVPEMVPKLVMLMAIKALLLIPVTLFGCLGFLWGKDLYNKLGQGYDHLAPPAPAPAAPPAAPAAQVATQMVQAQPVAPV